MMRRELIVLLGASIACSFVAPAAAQQAAKVPLIGILTPSADEASPPIAAFRRGMRDLGYVEGQTVRIVLSKANGDFTALPRLAAELAGIPVDVIVTDTTSATQAAFGATRTIPVVMGASGGDPVALGVAKSMARPGANVTGLLLRSSELNPWNCSSRRFAESRGSPCCSIRRARSDLRDCRPPGAPPKFWASKFPGWQSVRRPKCGHCNPTQSRTLMA
jgi:hypothetical protein